MHVLAVCLHGLLCLHVLVCMAEMVLLLQLIMMCKQLHSSYIVQVCNDDAILWYGWRPTIADSWLGEPRNNGHISIGDDVHGTTRWIVTCKKI